MKKTNSGVLLWNKAKKIIPGGNQLLSKRAEMFLPDEWPAYYEQAKGPYIWDLDGNKFLDMTFMGVGACILGYADETVNAAVIRAIEKGTMSTLNAPEEVELAKLLCRLHHWADMVRFARSGGEAMAIAVRIARAYSKKDKIAFCGYHGWHDWYLAANLSHEKNLDGYLLAGLKPAGVPRGLTGTMIPFHYNIIAELKNIFQKHRDIGTIVMEPVHHDPPKGGFLEEVRRIADRNGSVLIFDEISSGFKLNVGGAHLLYGVNPDLAVFAKAMSNGYPMAAVIGREKVMQAAQDSFISSTSWTDRIGPVAALATIKKLKRGRVHAAVRKKAEAVRQGLLVLAEKHHLKLKLSGLPTLVVLEFDYGKESQAIRTLFTQEMLTRGVLAFHVVFPSFSHRGSHIRKYLTAVDDVFGLLSAAISQKKVRRLLIGPVAHTGFERLT